METAVSPVTLAEKGFLVVEEIRDTDNLLKSDLERKKQKHLPHEGHLVEGGEEWSSYFAWRKGKKEYKGSVG